MRGAITFTGPKRLFSNQVPLVLVTVFYQLMERLKAGKLIPPPPPPPLKNPWKDAVPESDL